MHEPDIDGTDYAEFEEINQKPTVNVGTVGHCDHGTDVSDAEYIPVIPEDDFVADEKPKMTRGEVLEALKTAVDDGHVSIKEAKRIRRDLGIFGSSFTKSSQKNRKKKRNAQKNARKKQR